MTITDTVPNAQDAVKLHRIKILSAVIHRETGRHVVNLRPELISDPLIEIRCAGEGFGWHDKNGREWQQGADGRWRRAEDR